MKMMAVLLLLLLAACARPVACTMIGCSDGVSVYMPDLELSDSYIISINDMTYDSCADSGNIKRFGQNSLSVRNYNGTTVSVMYRDAVPESIHVRVYSRDDCSSKPVQLIDDSFIPEYRTFAPNGPECGPICRQAVINITRS